MSDSDDFEIGKRKKVNGQVIFEKVKFYFLIFTGT